MPARVLEPFSKAPDLNDKVAREGLNRLEPYLRDRAENKQRAAATKRKNKVSTPRTSTSAESETPAPPVSRPSRLGVRRFLRSQLHLLVFALIHIIFSLYIRIRQAYHVVTDRVISVFAYHHRTPELIQRDVRGFKKLPYHLSVILKLEDQGRGPGLEKLVNEAADVAAWCACAGVPVLSIYEKTGILKSYVPETHRAISQKLSLYFGRHRPGLSLGAPHVPSISAPSSRPGSSSDESDPGFDDPLPVPHLQVLLLSAEDGRDSIVDLTKTLAEMSQRGKIAPQDISLDVVDAELKEGVVGEPDLLVIFGPYPDLAGYPPWQLRLTEIFCMRDTTGVGYQVFLRGLAKFANAEMRWGR